MGLSFQWIPARHGDRAEEHLNAFLRRVRVLSIEKHFCGSGADPGWAVCIEYADTQERAGSNFKDVRVDYREVLAEADFRVFAALRKARKYDPGNRNRNIGFRLAAARPPQVATADPVPDALDFGRAGVVPGRVLVGGQKSFRTLPPGSVPRRINGHRDRRSER